MNIDEFAPDYEIYVPDYESNLPDIINDEDLYADLPDSENDVD